MRILALSLAGIMLLAACAPSAPSEAMVQTAIAETQAANPTATLTAAATATNTSTPAPTETATPTATATPDLRVIDVNPKKLVLSKTDFPIEGQYYLPTGWAYGPVTNSEIVSSWTVEEGQDYIARSGRVYGWEIEFARGSSKLVAPDAVWNEVVLYKMADAAKSVIEDDADCARFEGMSPVKLDFSIGDAVMVCMQNQNGQVSYRMQFSHRNLLALIMGWGSEVETNPAFFQALAQKQLAIFEAQPLSDNVTFSP